jgi:CheY-like chemotaxis protein
VDDNEDNAFMLYNLLRGAGYDAVTTLTPGDALMLAGSEQFDLFILDTRFRAGTGFELCRSIRETRPGAKVIFYSGAVLETDRERGLDAGAQAYVKKPEIEELLEAVRDALGDG